MVDNPDTAGVAVRPPVLWMVLFLIGFGLDWLSPLPFLPTDAPLPWIGGAVFAAGLALAVASFRNFIRAGTNVPTNRPTTAIVTSGPYRITRNPIYIGMLLGQAGLAIGFNSLWILATLIPQFLILNYGVVAREEAYLQRKFGAAYLDYKSRVRRWL
jgi:protein-S-isoprenylcysteine O-methyltransferase Ste14